MGIGSQSGLDREGMEDSAKRERGHGHASRIAHLRRARPIVAIWISGGRLNITKARLGLEHLATFFESPESRLGNDTAKGGSACYIPFKLSLFRTHPHNAQYGSACDIVASRVNVWY